MSNLSIFARPYIFEDERDLSSEEHRLDSTQVLIHSTLGKLNKMQEMCLVVKSTKPSQYAERAQAPVDSTEFLWDQKNAARKCGFHFSQVNCISFLLYIYCEEVRISVHRNRGLVLQTA